LCLLGILSGSRGTRQHAILSSEYSNLLQEDNPDSKKVADVAKAAGEVWRDMPEAKKAEYEEKSTAAKVKSMP
jgi:hypothetical protein